MPNPRVTFSAVDDPNAFQLLKELKQQGVSLKEIDQGYSLANFGGVHCSNPKSLSCVRGAKDGTISSTEVWEFALNQSEKYQQLIEGVLGKPLPWVLDDLNPKTTFDATVRKRVGDTIEVIRALLEQQGLKKISPAYEERLAIALYYLVASPRKSAAASDDPAQVKRLTTFDLKRAEMLNSLGLANFETYLQSTGGLRVERDNGKEYSALEALFIEEGKCTEQAKILFGVLTMAGLSPVFIEVNPWKTKLPDIQQALQQSPYYGHVCIGLRSGKAFRLFDPALLLIDPPHGEFYPLTPRQFLSSEYVQRGLFLEAKGGVKEAMKEYDLALQLDRWNGKLFLNRGYLFSKQGQSEQAKAAYSEAIRLNPNLAIAYDNRCHLLALDGEWDKAVADCNKAIQLNPDWTSAYLNRAYIWANTKVWSRVIEDITKVLAIDPTSFKAYNDRAGAFISTGDYARGIADFTKGLEYASTPEDRWQIYRNRALAWGKQQNWEKAFQDYSAALKIKPGNNDTLCGRGIAWAGKGEWDKALADFTAVIENDPEYVDAYSGRAKIWIKKHVWDAAIADATVVLTRVPTHARSYFDRGFARLQKGERKGAIEDFSKAIALNPSFAPAYVSRASAWIEEQEWDKAIEDCNRAIVIDPSNYAAYRDRGVSYAYKGNFDAAILDFDKSIELNSADVEAYLKRGWCWLLKGDDAKGMQDITSYMQFEPGGAGQVFDLMLPVVRDQWKTQQDGDVIKADLQNRYRLDAEQLQAWVITVSLLWTAGHTGTAVKQLASILKPVTDASIAKKPALNTASSKFLQSLFDDFPSGMQKDASVKNLWQQMGVSIGGL